MVKTMKFMVFHEKGEAKKRRIPLASLTKIQTIQNLDEQAYYLLLYADGMVFTTRTVDIVDAKIPSL